MTAMMSDDHLGGFDKMPTIYVALGLGIEAERLRDPPMQAFGVDDQIKADFARAGKPVVAIENGDAVLSRMETLPEATQRRLLADQLKSIATRRTLTQRMNIYHRWAKGELNSPDRWTNGRSAGDELKQRLLGERNAAWADVIAARMDEPGTILVAIGTAHLERKNSLLDLLGRRGLRAERLSPLSALPPRPVLMPMPASWQACSDYFIGITPVPPEIE